MTFLAPTRARRAAISFALASLAFLPVAGSAAEGTAATAEKPAPMVVVSGEVDVNSRYVWRGIAFSDGYVVNPSFTAAHGEWSLNAWANLDGDVSSPKALNEVDYTLGWSTNVLGFDVKPSALLYTFPGTGAHGTGELQVELGRPLTGPFSVFTRHSVDVVDLRGAAYSALGVGVAPPVWKGVTVAGSVAFGRGWWRFASAYADPALEGMNVMSANASATLATSSKSYVRLHLDWNQVGQRLVRETISGDGPAVFGAALGTTF